MRYTWPSPKLKLAKKLRSCTFSNFEDIQENWGLSPFLTMFVDFYQFVVNFRGFLPILGQISADSDFGTILGS